MYRDEVHQVHVAHAFALMQVRKSGVHISYTASLQMPQALLHMHYSISTDCQKASISCTVGRGMQDCCRAASDVESSLDLPTRLTLQRYRNEASAAKYEMGAVMKELKRHKKESERVQLQQQLSIRGLKEQVTLAQQAVQQQVALPSLDAVTVCESFSVCVCMRLCMHTCVSALLYSFVCMTDCLFVCLSVCGESQPQHTAMRKTQVCCTWKHDYALCEQWLEYLSLPELCPILAGRSE